MRKASRVLILIGLLAFSFLIPSSARSSGLGLSIEIAPTSDSHISQLTRGQRLWFLVPPGSSASRDVIIASSSNLKQHVELSLGYLKRENGIASIDDSKVADSKEWASFTPQSFDLPAGAKQKVTFTYSIPKDTKIGVHEAFLFATAGEVGTGKSAEYKLPQKARIASPVFLGVGNIDQIKIDFDLAKFDGVIEKGMPSGRLFIKNTGNTPVEISGSVEIQSATFSTLHFGPLSFNSTPIRPGETGFVLIPVGSNFTAGKYEILVSANQGSLNKSKKIVANITFKEPSKVAYYAIRLLIIVFFVLILALSIRVLRKTSKKGDSDTKVNKLSRRKKLKSSDSEMTDALESLSTDELLAMLERHAKERREMSRTRAAKSPAKKAIVKKLVTKKETTKKSTAKKSAAKEVVAKKAPVKKSATKKASTKNTVKKVVKKTAPKRIAKR